MTCRSCKAPILWVTTAAGKQMPLDAEAVADGNIAIVGGVAVVADLLTPPGERYRSHFVTCPDAAQHRRKR